MTVSGASATASLVNSSTNSTVKLPSRLNQQGKPGDEVQPQVGPILIFVGMILLDLLLSWALEKYVSPEAAMVYDAVSLLIPDPGDGLKLGIKVLAKHGDEITKYSIVIVKKDWRRTKVVRKITDVSASSVKWVKSALGEKYIKEIAEKYVVKKGKNFDEVANSLKRIQSMGITSAKARRLIIDRGWDVKKLERVLSDAKSVKKGGNKLIKRINAELRDYKEGRIKKLGGHLYEAEVVSNLKKSGWRVKEVEKDVRTSIGKTEIDIIAEKNGRTFYIECKRSFYEIDIGQIAKQAEYARNHGVRTIKIYYARGPSYPPTYILQKLREISSKYNVDISLVYLGSSFN